jgi:hypothetical protein
MPRCRQCNNPAMYAIGQEQVPSLCMEHAVLHQNMVNQQLAELRRQQEQALDDMEMATGVPVRALMGQRRPQPVVVQRATFNSINIRDSNVGVVNTGQLTQVDTAITTIARQGNAQLAAALKSLTEVVLANSALSSPAKKEAVEILSTLSGEATLPANQRKSSIGRTLISRLKEVLGVGADVVEATKDALDIVATAFAGG